MQAYLAIQVPRRDARTEAGDSHRRPPLARTQQISQQRKYPHLDKPILGKVAIGNDITRFRCHREKTAVPPDQTGVYNVCRGQWGARKVTGQGHIFRRGADLQTVEKNTSLSDAPLTQIATEGLPQCAVRLRTNMPQGGYTGTLGDGVELDEFHRSLLTSVQRDTKQKQTNRFANPKVL